MAMIFIWATAAAGSAASATTRNADRRVVLRFIVLSLLDNADAATRGEHSQRHHCKVPASPGKEKPPKIVLSGGRSQGPGSRSRRHFAIMARRRAKQKDQKDLKDQRTKLVSLNEWLSSPPAGSGAPRSTP